MYWVPFVGSVARSSTRLVVGVAVGPVELPVGAADMRTFGS